MEIIRKKDGNRIIELQKVAQLQCGAVLWGRQPINDTETEKSLSEEAYSINKTEKNTKKFNSTTGLSAFGD